MQLALILSAACLWSSAFVDWRVVYGETDIPVADILAMLLSGGFGLYLLKTTDFRKIWGQLSLEGPNAPLAFPAAFGWGLFLMANWMWCLTVHAQWQMVYFVFRKPFFCWMAFGVGLAGVIRLLPAERLRQVAFIHAFWLAGLILPPALWLVISGYSGAIMELPGLINNHKVLAVALAPWLGALWQWRPLMKDRIGHYADAIIALVGVALLASMSKAAWITALMGLGAFIPWRGRPLLARPIQLSAIAAGSFGIMMALPFISRSPDMADAFDSRWSLNVRAWIMFTGHPLTGWGPGTATRWLMNDPRHYRIDGVDAHGVIQKVASENGLMGLIPYMLAYGWFMHYFWRAAMQSEGNRYVQGAAILGIGLHLNLLLSTDYFSSAHWGPLAIALGIIASQPSQRT